MPVLSVFFAISPAERINLFDEVPLRKPADSRVAGHLCDGIGIDGDDQRLASHAGGGKRRFAPGVSRTDDDDIIRLLVRVHRNHVNLSGSFPKYLTYVETKFFLENLVSS